MSDTDKNPDIAQLSGWFSDARMARYATAEDPAALYAWDVRLQKAFLEDVEHVEVLLRNFIAQRLAADCLRRTGRDDPNSADRRWYDHPDLYNLNDKFASSVGKAKSRLRREQTPTDYDHVVAALSFDTWRFLLVRRLEPTVWRALRSRENGGMPNYPGTSREDFESRVTTIYHLRNRCSHQEHLVLNDEEEERRQLDQYADALAWVAGKIDPGAAEWMASVSRVSSLRSERPSRRATSGEEKTD